jgi:hypothetical protein
MEEEKRKFRNSWRRLDRAAHHLLAFNAELSAILADDAFTTITRYDKDSAWDIAGILLSESAIKLIRDNRLSLELGEYAYQLRAALDGLIWDAITFTQGTEPHSDANRLEFPILNGKVAKFQDCGFLKFPFPTKLRDWLETVQPYTAIKPLDDPDRGVSTCLDDIHDLARFDRHRRLRVVAVVPTGLKFGVESVPPCKVVARERIDSCNLLGGPYEFLRFRIETAEGIRPEEARLKTELTFEILLEDIEPFDGVNAGEQLEMLLHVVRYIIMKFEENFC